MLYFFCHGPIHEDQIYFLSHDCVDTEHVVCHGPIHEDQIKSTRSNVELILENTVSRNE